MPTIVSYFGNNAFKPKDNGEPGERMVYNTLNRVWEDIEAPRVTKAQHAVK